jgi:hypothetical protein
LDHLRPPRELGAICPLIFEVLLSRICSLRRTFQVYQWQSEISVQSKRWKMHFK